MLDNISDSIKAHLYERTSSPFIGSFTLTWFFWNYQTILIIFSGLTPAQKIDYIENTIYNFNQQKSLIENILSSSPQLFLYPFLSSLVLVFIVPFITYIFYMVWKWHQVNLVNLKITLEGKQTITNEAYKALKEEFYRLKNKLSKEIEDKEEEIKYLRKNINISDENTNPDQKSEHPAFSNEHIDELEQIRNDLNSIKYHQIPSNIREAKLFKILSILSHNNGSLDNKKFEEKLINEVTQSISTKQNLLKELIDLKLISRDDLLTKITKDGKKFFKDNQLTE